MMKKKIVSGIMLTLILLSMLTLAFNIQPVNASGTIYIRADGSVDPPTAPIQRDGNIYTFTDNIHDEIVVYRDNIVVDGAGYTLKGMGSGTGIDLMERKGVTIKNLEIKTFYYGIFLELSGLWSPITISRTNITGNWVGIKGGYQSVASMIISNSNIKDNSAGISLEDCYGITIIGNNITNNGLGIGLSHSSDNDITGNDITNNGVGIRIVGGFPNPMVHNNIFRNNIINNDCGIELDLAYDSKFYHIQAAFKEQ